MLEQSKDTEQELLVAVAVGQAKRITQYELTQQALEAGCFAAVEAYISPTALVAARLAVQRSYDEGLEVWPLTAPNYPALLREIDSPPAALFVKRGPREKQVPDSSIAVVGRRAASLEVCQEATRLGRGLAEAGITVVSGLALGIDAAAHRGALLTRLNVPTIAVLAHGLDNVYPPTHALLARQILDAGGMLLSEYAPGVQPMRHYFLARNRIIAGLSRGVVVVQAGARSGSLVTARCAVDNGRDVFVMRGMAEPEGGEGGDDLIEQGAIPISDSRDVLAEYGLLTPDDTVAAGSQWVIDSVESFLARRGWGASELLKLELAGVVELLPGNRVRYQSEDRGR